MGVDYTAYTIIGVKLSVTDLIKVEHVEKKAMFPKDCCKDYFETDYKCCPRCGGHLWRSEKEFRSRIDDWTEEDWENREFFGFQIVADGGWYSNGKGNLFIGVKGGGYGEVSSKMNVPNIDKIKNNLWKILFPLDLWDEETFGIWTYLDVSY